MNINEMPEIIYIGNIGIPNTALSIHAQNMARLFYRVGYHTTFICDRNKSENMFRESSEIYDYCYTKNYIRFPKISALEWLLDELTGWKYKKILYEKVKVKKPEFILLYGYAGEEWLIKYCRKNKIPLLVERVDWFEKSDRKGFIGREIFQRQVDNCINKKDKLTDGIIVISKYFEKYYNQMNKLNIFIPPIFDFEQNKKISRFYNDGKIRLVYAGSFGGNKDQILPLLRAIKEINKNEIHIFVNIIGSTMKEIEKVTSKSYWDKYGIKAYGRIENKKAQEIIEKCDFSLLLRENKRYAKAGFSTKFAESMCLGVPVICTKVGGADLIIKNMEDGVLLENNEIETIKSTLYCLLDKSSDEIVQMKKNTYEKACKFFFEENYIQDLKKFIKEVKKTYE